MLDIIERIVEIDTLKLLVNGLLIILIIWVLRGTQNIKKIMEFLKSRQNFHPFEVEQYSKIKKIIVKLLYKINCDNRVSLLGLHNGQLIGGLLHFEKISTVFSENTLGTVPDTFQNESYGFYAEFFEPLINGKKKYYNGCTDKIADHNFRTLLQLSGVHYTVVMPIFTHRSGHRYIFGFLCVYFGKKRASELTGQLNDVADIVEQLSKCVHMISSILNTQAKPRPDVKV